MIKSADLIAKFVYALANLWGYIWGAAGILWTEAKQQQKVNYMRQKYGENWKTSDAAKGDTYWYAAMYGAKWIGHYVADCSGLFAWAFKQLGGSIAHGSNSIWNSYCSKKGKLKGGKRTDGEKLKPGSAVFTYNSAKKNRGHIGLYIGDGWVIEASGTKAGVVKSSVGLAKWVEWGELKGVDYDGSDPDPDPDPGPAPGPEPGKGEAVVTGTRVALRYGPTTSAGIIMRVDTGKIVKLTDEDPAWERVTYNGKIGYMMGKYLRKG